MNEIAQEQAPMLVNMIQLPSGKYLESRHVHDFREAEGCFVDGGLEYHRSGGNAYKIKTLYSTSPHEELREFFRWGTYGRNGKFTRKLVKLKDLSNSHIEAILDHLDQVGGLSPIQNQIQAMIKLFLMEIHYRIVHQIYVPENEGYTDINYPEFV